MLGASVQVGGKYAEWSAKAGHLSLLASGRGIDEEDMHSYFGRASTPRFVAKGLQHWSSKDVAGTFSVRASTWTATLARFKELRRAYELKCSPTHIENMTRNLQLAANKLELLQQEES